MGTSEEQIIIKTMVEDRAASNNDAKSHNAGLRALLSIKKFAATLEKEYSEVLQVGNELKELNKKGLLIITAHTLPVETALWKAVILEVNNAVSGIHDTLTLAKEKIVQTEKNDSHDLWIELAAHLSVLLDNSKNAANSGLKLLPEAIHPQWEREFVKAEALLVESVIIHVDSCRVLLRMIERYTPDELNAITRMIVDHVPEHVTYEEAEQYHKDYNKELVNFKNEFKAEKNLWDKFLDILAGGTHQSPSEKVMMGKWVDGEESNL